MSDMDCEYCGKESKCKFAYDSSSCRVREIKEAKQIVDASFVETYEKFKSLNELCYNEDLNGMLMYMRNLVEDSEIKLEEDA